MKSIYTTSALVDAELFRVRLRKRGIQSLLDGENAGLSGPATPYSVVVQDKDVDRAEKLLGEVFPKKKRTRSAAKKKPARRRSR
jgi:hypothetical protein